MGESSDLIETMSCEELLRELARLTAARDRDTAAVMGDSIGTGASHATLADERDQLSRIAELIKARGCDGSAA